VKKMIQRGRIVSPENTLISRRISARVAARGVISLTNGENLVVARMYDIAMGGISFLYAEDCDLPGGEIKMDILLFETLANVELFMSQAKSRISWRKYMHDPEEGTAVLRAGVEFLDLSPLHRAALKGWIRTA